MIYLYGEKAPSVKIVVGSVDWVTFNATYEADRGIGRYSEVIGFDCPSGQNAQPVGFDETFAGAMKRLSGAEERIKDYWKNKKAIYIGVENGIVSFAPDVWMDISIVVAKDYKDKIIITTTRGIQIPLKCVKIAQSRGFETTSVREVVVKEIGDSIDYSSPVLSDYMEMRKSSLIEALSYVLIQAAYEA